MRNISDRGPVENYRERLVAIVESSREAIFGNDLNGIVTSWNGGATAIFGYAPEEMLGASIARVIPPERLNEVQGIVENIRRGERAELLQIQLLAKDGRQVEVSIAISPIRDIEGRVVGASSIAHDITALKQREREIARLSRLYAALSQINHAIVRMPARDELFRDVCRALVEQGGFRMAWIGWYMPDTQQLMPVASCGDEGNYLQTIAVYTDDRPEGRGPAGSAFRMDKPYLCNDLLSDPATLPWRAELHRRSYRAAVALPMRMQGTPCGTLTVLADQSDFFHDKEMALLEEAAADLSFALDNAVRDAARREAEHTLHHEKLFSDTMIESMAGVVYFYDAQGRFLRWNRNFETVSGYSAQEIARMHPLDFFADNVKPLLESRIAEVFASGESSVEAEFVAKDGTSKPYFFTGRLVQFQGTPCLVGVGIDISPRIRAEEARAASETRYRKLFDCAPDGIVIADQNSYYLDVNDSICKMLGYSREQLIGMHATDIVVHEEVQSIAPALQAINSGADHQREWRFRRKDGTIFDAEVLATAMSDGSILGMIRDITDRKLVEAEREKRHRAEAADRIKSAFLAAMSHELRTPLNSIIGFTGIILQGLAGPLNSEQGKQLDMVRSSARHLLSLVNDVLDISKIEAGQLDVTRERFDIRKSIDKVMSLVRPQAEAKLLGLYVELDAELGEAINDERRFEQVLLNLLSNAIKFTEHGSVTLRAQALVDFTFPSTTFEQAAIRVCVSDTGIGIKPEDLPLLFQPFQQIDSGLTRQHDGTGLGLAISHRLAALMGGIIEVESEWTKGSVFTVTLPMVAS